MRAFLPLLRPTDRFTRLRRRDFARLDQQRHTYLDYTGGNLAPASLVRAHAELLATEVLGNPHSVNPSSKRATDLCESARERVLGYFGGSDDYYCVFTANATAALKLVGECFPWRAGSRYLLTADNHNSVHGIRRYATAGGAAFEYTGLDDDLGLDGVQLDAALDRPGAAPSLFALPAQSNASGVKHNLGWLTEARRRGWHTLLDAAAFAPTNRLNLRTHRPDFACVSFYKIFGYPTGIGCLLIHKEAFGVLQKRWFAGGTVTISSIAEPAFHLHDGHERFENGTIDFLGLPAIEAGLDYIDRIGVERIGRHVGHLSEKLAAGLRGLSHPNGRPQIALYGPADRRDCGGTLLFNVLREDGSRVPFATVERAAVARNISLRAGCFCNPGVDEAVNGVGAEELRSFYGRHERPHFGDMLASRPGGRGCVRVSLGLASSTADVERFLAFIAAHASAESVATPILPRKG